MEACPREKTIGSTVENLMVAIGGEDLIALKAEVPLEVVCS